MFNIIMTTTRRQQQQKQHQQHCSKSTSERKGQRRRRRCYSSTMITMLVTMTILVLTVSSTITSTLAESETNDLNALDSSKKPTTTIQSDDVAATANKQSKPETRQYPYTGFMAPPSMSLSPSLAGCPLCDSSVYSYCSHKLIHDSCCCDFPGSMIYQKPPQCVYFDCSLLYAKSCYEHALIKNCCCNNPY